MKNIFNNKDMIKLIYDVQSKKIDEIIKKVNLELKEKLPKVELDKKVFSKIEENYNIKISKYNEEIYKKGFIDGVNIILNCIKEEK